MILEDHAHKQNNKVLIAPDGIILILDSQRVFQRWKIGAPAIPEIFKTFENTSFEKRTNITELQNLKKKINEQKQSSRAVLIKRCSENIQQMYRRTPMPKCDFNKVAKQLY